jgi:ATP-dependent DNA helicase RecQ
VRPELKYETLVVPTAKLDHGIVSLLLANRDDLENGRAIVFCLFIAETMSLVEVINAKFGRRIAAFYHGQMTGDDRKIAQDDWMEGAVKVMVATKAFGTGIDYASIRIVIHKSQSSSLLDYAQETGRAGRDGKASKCLTVFDGNNRSLLSNEDIGLAQRRERQEMFELLKVRVYAMAMNFGSDCKAS